MRAAIPSSARNLTASNITTGVCHPERSEGPQILFGGTNVITIFFSLGEIDIHDDTARRTPTTSRMLILKDMGHTVGLNDAAINDWVNRTAIGPNYESPGIDFVATESAS